MNTRSEHGRRNGAVVLAAGGSRRLGRAKQLVRHEERTLLERTITAAVESDADPVVVVLGAAADEIRAAIQLPSERVRFVVNERWAEGMGTSIARGVQTLLEIDPAADSALILVCDQPALDASVLTRLLQLAAAEPTKILLSDYGAGRGPPVLFPRFCFNELLGLRGDSGAREVHRRHADVLLAVPFPGGALDIDVPRDLKALES